eukprot:1795994-Amphidinium_carterae.1
MASVLQACNCFVFAFGACCHKDNACQFAVLKKVFRLKQQSKAQGAELRHNMPKKDEFAGLMNSFAETSLHAVSMNRRPTGASALQELERRRYIRLDVSGKGQDAILSNIIRGKDAFWNNLNTSPDTCSWGIFALPQGATGHSGDGAVNHPYIPADFEESMEDWGQLCSITK